MAWIKVDQTICTHKKTLKLAYRLGVEIPQAIGLMVTLWLWALDNAPDGSLEDIEPLLLARAIGWNGDPQRLVESMQAVGLIDGDRLHNWEEHNGKLMDQRQAAKARARKSREARTTAEPDDSEEAREEYAHVARTVRETCAHVTTQSRVDQSRQDQSRQETPPEPPEGATAGPEESEKASLQEERFAQFWSRYPKKVGKAAALKAWKRAKPDAALFTRIMDKIEQARSCEQWQRENGRFVPNPATWIGQGRWDDELTASSNSATQSEIGGPLAPDLGGFTVATGDEEWGRRE